MNNAVYHEVEQHKLSALSAMHLHTKRLSLLGWLSRVVDFIAIAVPILYLPVRYVFKGTIHELPVEIAWEILAGVLVGLTILKIMFRWEESGKEHSSLMGENSSLARQADDILENIDSIAPDTLRFFRQSVDRVNLSDRKSIGGASGKDKQWAYREAIKELRPSDSKVTCPQCGSSPYFFRPGSCQVCGNTPANDVRTRR